MSMIPNATGYYTAEWIAICKVVFNLFKAFFFWTVVPHSLELYRVARTFFRMCSFVFHGITEGFSTILGGVNDEELNFWVSSLLINSEVRWNWLQYWWLWSVGGTLLKSVVELPRCFEPSCPTLNWTELKLLALGWAGLDRLVQHTQRQRETRTHRTEEARFTLPNVAELTALKPRLLLNR